MTFQLLVSTKICFKTFYLVLHQPIILCFIKVMYDEGNVCIAFNRVSVCLSLFPNTNISFRYYTGYFIYVIKDVRNFA